MGSHGTQKQMPGRPQIRDPNPLAFQIGEAAAVLVDKEFEAADMNAAEHRQLDAMIEPIDEYGGKVQPEIHLAAGDARRRVARLHVADIGKTFRAQQLFGNVLGRNADAGFLYDPDSSRLQRPLRRQHWRSVNEARSASQ